MMPKATTDARKKKEQILQKVTKLFTRKGYEGTSTNDICQAVKLTKPSLYYYFENKNHLLFSVHMRSIETVLKPYLEEVSSISDPEMRLRAMISKFTRIACSHPELRFLLHQSLTIKDKYFKEIRREWKKHYLLLRETILELQSTGGINRKLNASWASLEVLGMISWITFWYDYSRKDQIGEIADSVVNFVFSGLGSGGLTRSDRE